MSATLNGQKVALEWAEYPYSEDFDGYQIYRFEPIGNYWKPIGKVPKGTKKSEFSCSDCSESNPYYYAITVMKGSDVVITSDVAETKKETATTAGIFTGLNLFIEQMDSNGKVTDSSWGDLGFGFLWGDHDIKMKDGKFLGNVFSGSWDYEEANSHHKGKMDITLDDEVKKATKVVSFSAENTEQIISYGKITQKLEGTGGSLPPPTTTQSNPPWGPLDTTTFEMNGTGTCGSIPSYNYEFIPNVDGLVHTIVRYHQCNNQSRLIIQFKEKLK